MQRDFTKIETPYLDQRVLYIPQRVTWGELLLIVNCLDENGNVDPSKVPDLIIGVAHDVDGNKQFGRKDVPKFMEMDAMDVLDIIEKLGPVTAQAFQKKA